MFVVAYHLRRPFDEIAEMSVDEFLHWCAFLKWIAPKRTK